MLYAEYFLVYIMAVINYLNSCHLLLNVKVDQPTLKKAIGGREECLNHTRAAVWCDLVFVPYQGESVNEEKKVSLAHAHPIT